MLGSKSTETLEIFFPPFETITMMITIKTDTITMGQIPFQVVYNYLI